MTPAQILSYATEHHIRLATAGGKLILETQDGELPADLIEAARRHKPALIRELTVPADGRWNPELAADGYVWCLDCRHWGGGGIDRPDAGPGCTHPDNRFRCQQPLAPRKCRWYADRN